MGGKLSKVNCSGDVQLYKKHLKSRQRPLIHISTPIDFKHTYHVGNSSPVSDQFDSSDEREEDKEIMNNPNFLETIAQITTALEKLPANSAPNLSEKEKQSIIKMSKSTTAPYPIYEARPIEYHKDFSSCLQSRIDAQIVDLITARSKRKQVKAISEETDVMI